MKARLAAIVAILLAGCGVVACTIPQSDTAEESHAATEEKVAPPSISVEDGEDEYNPDEPVVVTSDVGLDEVVMKNEAGYEVEAELSEDGKTWKTAEPLGYYRFYSLSATDTEGNQSTAEFSTVSPASLASAWFNAAEGSELGTGYVITITFSQPIADHDAVEEAVTITTSNDTSGAFHWFGDSDLRWRPDEYWEPGTEVTVNGDFYGVKLGDGVYGDSDISLRVTIGEKIAAVVDDATKTMEVYRGDELLRTMPVSMGTDYQWPTPNGIYIVGDRNPSMIMDSETFGLSKEKGGYRTQVDFATQLSYSGIYVHAAPWSVWAQGSTNTSHGCINVSYEDARWFQETVKRGDIVTIKNTVGGEQSAWDGLGSWNMSDEDWGSEG